MALYMLYSRLGLSSLKLRKTLLLTSSQKVKSTASSQRPFLGSQDDVFPEKSTVIHDDLFSALNLTLVLFDFLSRCILFEARDRAQLPNNQSHFFIHAPLPNPQVASDPRFHHLLSSPVLTHWP